MSNIGTINQFNRLIITPQVCTDAKESDIGTPSGSHNREILVIGPSIDGDPNPDTIIRQSDLNQMSDIIGNEDVPVESCLAERINPIRAMNIMQNPSNSIGIAGARIIDFIRVGKPTRPKWVLLNDSAQPVIDVYRTSWGTFGNESKLKIETPSVVKNGKTISFIKTGSHLPNVRDNLGRGIRIAYIGAGSECLLTITLNSDDEAIRLTTTVDGVQDLSLDLTKYNTIGKLASVLRGYDDYSAEVDPNSDSTMYSKYLDAVNAVNIRQFDVTAITGVTANSITKPLGFAGLDLVGRWINPNVSDGLDYWLRVVSNDDNTVTFENIIDVTALTSVGNRIRIGGLGCDAILGSIIFTLNKYESQNLHAVKSGTAVGVHYEAPRNINYITPTTPGTYPEITYQDWIDALAKADRLFQKSGAVFPLSEDPAVWILFDNYVRSVKQTYSRNVRMFAGPALNTDALEPLDWLEKCAHEKLMIDNTWSTIVCNGIKRTNEFGDEEIFSSMYSAAAVAGAWVGTGETQPLTGKNISCLGLEHKFIVDETDYAILNGLTVLNVDEDNDDGVTGFLIVKAITTFTQTDSEMYRGLWAMTAVETINQMLKRNCWPIFYGKIINIHQGTGVKNAAIATLREAARPGPNQILMADPQDPVKKPAFYPPFLRMTKTTGNIGWKGNIAAEGDILLISGLVEFTDPVFV